MTKILITGGCGFIGQHLATTVRDLGGGTPIIYDDLSAGSRLRAELAEVELIVGDVLDTDRLIEAMHDCEVVVHLAARGNVVQSVAEPLANFQTNALGTFNVLNTARLAGVRKVLFASTGGALIGDAEPPVNERSLPRPISPYGASKLCGEAYCSAFASAYGIETVALRFSNVIGPYSAHKTGVINRFFQSIMVGEPLTIYGDGSSSRDYLYVEDLCAGIHAALTHDAPGFRIYHLASGQEVPITQVAQVVANTTGNPDHPIAFKPSRPGEVARNFASCVLAQRDLGFRPSVTFEDAVGRTWDWFVASQNAS